MRKKLKIKLIHKVRLRIWIIIIGLALSGLTAFPIETELGRLCKCFYINPEFVREWLFTVYDAVKYTNQNYPYLSYGTDWLAFAHLLFAVLFVGAVKDPVKNIWVIEFGIIAAIAIFPLAFIAGGIRGIPIFWRLIDCSFGLITLIVLLPCHHLIKKLTHLNTSQC
jgi:hypothetical protein